MFTKSFIAAAALLSLAGAVSAGTTDWGVHGNPAESATPTVTGSFTDYYTFSIPAGFNLLASVTVSNNIIVPLPFGPPLSVYQITGGMYSLWSDLGPVGVGGADTMLGGWSFNGTSGSTVNSVSISAGTYYYKVTGNAIGSNGGLYTITSAIAPVPEPETYALMLAGLGAVGFVAARRRPRV